MKHASACLPTSPFQTWMRRQPAAIAFALVLLALASPLRAAEPDVGQYLRVSDDPGREIALQIASRDFRPADGEGPVIGLIGVAHVAERDFFNSVAKLLERYDLVLYEAVQPDGVRPPRGDDEEQRIAATQDALRFVASAVESHRQTHGRYPADLDELREYARTLDGVITNWLQGAMTDAWGREIIYQRLEEPAEGQRGYVLKSHGPPNGGNDAAGVIKLDADAVIEPLAPKDDNLQQRLAEALNLDFQLTALPYASTNWRPSDMSMSELESAFAERGVEFSQAMGAIGGAGLSERLAGILLRMIQALDAMTDGAVSELMKVMMIDLLGDERMVEASLRQMGRAFTEVIIDERNQVVINDVARILAEEPEIESIALLYGAAHMADFEDRFRNQLEYVPDGTEHWYTAIRVDLQESAMDARQLTRMRLMMRQMITGYRPCAEMSDRSCR